MNPPLKPCSKCKRPFPATLEYFYACKTGHDGLMSECKECRRAYAKAHRIIPEINERERIRKQQYRATPEVKERNRDYQREWARQPHIRERHKRYRDTHKEEIRIRNITYRQQPAQKEKARQRRQSPEFKIYMGVYSLKRRTRRKGLPATLTVADWRRALVYWDHKCCVCGRAPDFWTVLAKEHWNPVCKGGGYTPDNILPMCHSVKGGEGGCNNTKNASDPIQWLIWRLGKRKARQKLKAIEAYFEWAKGQSK